VGIVTCEDDNVSFYENCEWRFVDNHLLLWDRENPGISEERVALKYISDRAKKHWVDFETTPIYFEEEW
jgi:hypothetical protein